MDERGLVLRVQRKTARRWLISAVAVVAFGAGAYLYAHRRASDRVKTQILKVVDQMTLPPGSRDELRQLLTIAHEKAFEKALDTTRTRGPKFDENVYFEQVFDQAADLARQSGQVDLADQINCERVHFSLDVTER